ncbi:hypothetical protein [Kistimonas asteriae]|nr:hypothetical protein [Kistimonas asteriae]
MAVSLGRIDEGRMVIVDHSGILIIMEKPEGGDCHDMPLQSVCDE